VVGVILLAHSLSLTEIVGAQSQTLGILPVWFLLLQPLGALLFFTAAVAELERIPFDLPEAEAELVEGWKTEYGGLRFGLIMFTEWARAFAGCSLFVLLFLGGWQGPLMETSLFGMDLGPIIGLVWFFIKVYIVFGVMVWVRASFPRVRIDQLLRVCWNTLLPLGLINIFLTVMVITLLSGFGVTYAIGFALGSFFLMVLLLFVRPEVEPLPQEDTLTSGGKKERTPALRTLVLKPLWVTMKHLFRRPATLMYPYETLKKPHTTAYYPVTKKIARVYEDGVFGVPDIWRNYRGAIGLDVDACISCGLCGRICPNRCITYVEFPGRDKNKKVPRVDFGVCMFCGLCAEYCPKGCIFLTSEYDLSAFDRNDLIYGPEKLSMFRGLKPETRFPERARELPSWEISKCIGCQLCSRRCPTGAITMIDSAIYIEKYGITWDETKKRPKSLPEFTGDKCVSCGTCAEVCPRRVITMDTPDSKGGIDK
jgi:formate hydrogenlyase subunit 6/NADH:ubiquinone oxidoreductase subunit I